MIDTIKITRAIDTQEHNHLLNSTNLNFIPQPSSTNQEEIYHKCYVKNLVFFLYPQSINIHNSLAKFQFNGENISAFTFHDLQESLDDLSNLLELDLEHAQITKMDVGINISMDLKTRNYQKLLLSHKTKGDFIQCHNTFYCEKEGIKIYDKLKKSKTQANKYIKDQNLLRIEFSIKNMTKQFGKECLVTDLRDFSFYKKLYLYFNREFSKIEFSEYGTMDFLDVTSPKDFFERIKRQYIIEKGNDKIEDILIALKDRGNLETNQVYRISKKIKDLMNQKIDQSKRSLVDELKSKVRMAIRYKH